MTAQYSPLRNRAFVLQTRTPRRLKLCMPYRLIPSHPSANEVGEAIHDLLVEYKNGTLTGLAFVKHSRRGRYDSKCLGSCSVNAGLTRGALGELMDKVAAIQHSIHPDDTR